MSVTTTSYTTNTKKIAIFNEMGNGSTNIIAAVDSAITGGGWTSYDTVNVANTTPFNAIVTKVYRALNADGITYKYLIVRFDTIKTMIYTSCCESWNTSTHTPTNESWTQAGAFAQGYDVMASTILVNASVRHCMIWTFIVGIPGLWTAVVEFERVAAEDLATVATTPTPCFAWINSVTFGTGHGSAAQLSNYMINPPRTAPIGSSYPNGLSSPQSSAVYGPITSAGAFPPKYAQFTNTFTDTLGNGYMLGSYYYSLTYGWNTAAFPNSPISIEAQAGQYGGYLIPFGRIYNFGVTKNIGNAGDTILANIDATYGWPSGNTTSQTECLLLPMNGGYETQISYNATSGGSSGSWSYFYANISYTTYGIPVKAISLGDTVFIAVANSASGGGSGGIATISQAAGSGQTPVTRFTAPGGSAAGGVYDIMFDGNTYIYGTTANGIVQMNANTFSYTYFSSNQTIANGCAYLGMDNRNVYACNRLASTKPQVYTFDRSTGNVYFGNTYNPPTAFTVASGWGTPVPDYTGNVYVAQTAGTTAAQSMYMGIFSANTGANVAYVATTASGGLNGSANYGHSIYYDYISNRVFELYPVPSTNYINVAEIWAGNLTLGGVSGFTGSPIFLGAGTTASYWYSSLYATGTPDYRGDQFIIPWRGLWFAGIKKPGVDQRNTTYYGTSGFGYLISYSFTPASTSLGTSTYSILGVPYGASPWPSTNTIQFFHPLSSPQSVDNRVLVLTGLYTPNNTYNYSMSRLLLKG